MTVGDHARVYVMLSVSDRGPGPMADIRTTRSDVGPAGEQPKGGRQPELPEGCLSKLADESVELTNC